MIVLGVAVLTGQYFAHLNRQVVIPHLVYRPQMTTSIAMMVLLK